MKERFPRLRNVEFTECGRDVYSVEDTAAGEVETMYFHERRDFENAVTALVYRPEPRAVPPSIGAIFVSGLTDHVRMEKTAVIILSRGGYSGLSAEDVKDAYRKYDRSDADKWDDLTETKWEELSFIIRKNHELEHFVQSKLFPDEKNVIKNEVMADQAGIVAATGSYDGFLARLFLGIEGDAYRRGGRLENYFKGQVRGKEDMRSGYADTESDACREAEKYIEDLEKG